MKNKWIKYFRKLCWLSCLLIITTKMHAGSVDSLKQVLVNCHQNQKPKILIEIGDYFIHQAGDSSFIYFMKLIDKHFGDCDEIAEIYQVTGEIYIKKNEFEKAYLNINQAMKLFQIQENELGLAYCKRDLAFIFSKFYDFEAAINNLMEAIRFFKENDLIADEADAHVNLGDIFFQLAQYDDAFDLYSNALTMYLQIPDTLKIAKSYYKIAKVIRQQGDVDNALSYFQRGLSIFEKYEDQKSIANSYYEMAGIYNQTDDFSKADIYYGKAIKIFEKLDDIQESARSYLALATYYLSIEENDKALYYLNEAEIAADFVNSKELLVDIYQNLSLFYENQKIYDKAISYYKKYANTKDSLSTKTQFHKLTQIKSLLDNQAKSETIRKLEADSYFKSKALEKQRYFLIASIFAGILALFIVFIFYKQSRRRKISNLELLEKNNSLLRAENELKLSNNELQKSEKRLKDIVQNMPVLVSANSPDGVILFWNKACEIVTGYSSSEVINNNLVSQQISANAKEIRKSILQKDEIALYGIEYEIDSKFNGKKHIIWTNMSTVFPIEGWADWHVGIDVTERNLIEKTLERETAILNAILDSIPHPIFYKNKEGQYLGANPAFYQLYNLADNQLVGKNDNDIFPKEDADYFISTDLIILKNSMPYKELRWSGNNPGDGLLFDTIKTPLIDLRGEIFGIVGISFDMTERYHIEQELKKQKEKAEEADRLKSAFLANMSHEIRSPMNAIIGFSNLVTDSFGLDSEIATYMGYINQSGVNLLQLLDDIIDIAKIEAGQLKIRKDKFDLNDMLEKLRATVETSFGKAKKDKLTINLNIPPDSGQPIIYSDELRIRQVLNNFLSNAFKFTDEGIIEFGYKKLPENEILFFTKDTGIGIAESDKELIFNRFGQVQETYIRNTSGTGLGLAISKSIVEMLEGQIWLESVEKVGSTFYFKIPVEYSTQLPEKKSETQYSIRNYNWKGKHILIAEDDDMNYNVLKSLLERTKVTLSRAENGNKAVELALSDLNPDLILMDIQLPHLNGYEASIQIKKVTEIPIIAITAYAMRGEKEKSLEAGCNYFITKPFNRNELLHQISIYLS